MMLSKMNFVVVLLLLGVAAAHACRPVSCPSPAYLQSQLLNGCPVCVLPPGTCKTTLSLPVCCGTGTGVSCPLSVSCASSFSSVIAAGPSSCSLAASRITATSTSYSKSAFTQIYVGLANQMCNAVTASNVCDPSLVDPASPDFPINAKVEQYATLAASSYAKACASVMSNWQLYACGCGANKCTTQTCIAAETNVTAQLAAVASAQAYAFAEAWASIDVCGTDENGLPINQTVLADGWAESLAQATTQAAISVYKSLQLTPYNQCQSICGSQTEIAIAKASACAFAKAFAQVIATGYATSTPIPDGQSCTLQCSLDATTSTCAATQAKALTCTLPNCYTPFDTTCTYLTVGKCT